MIGFSYNAIHSRTYNITAKSVNRPLLPVLRKRELTIPGRHGVYDFTDNTFDKRIIEVEMKYIGTSFAELRTRARSIAAWLSGFNNSKNLIFDDETDKYYLAKIYSEIGLQNLFKTGEASIIFECAPFAYSITERTETANITTSGQIVTISSSGTFDTPPVITIANNGTSAISTFTIRREELVD